MPIFTIAPTNVVFLTPPYQKVYPTYEGKLTTDASSVDLFTFSNEERLLIRRLASSINSMLDSMNLKDDVFSMGTYSSLLAGVLEYSPVCMSRRKASS